jgi:hypothetical protein
MFSYVRVGAIIGVRTSGMLIVVKSMPLSRNSDAAQAANEIERGFGRDVGGKSRRVRQHADRRDVDDVAVLLLGHFRHEARNQADRAEVVELHRALEIMEAVERVHDAAADRSPGVVDQVVAGAVILEHLRHQRVARRHVGDVAGVYPALAAGRLDFLLRVEQLFLAVVSLGFDAGARAGVRPGKRAPEAAAAARAPYRPLLRSMAPPAPPLV